MKAALAILILVISIMVVLLKRGSVPKREKPAFSEEVLNEYQQAKQSALEKVLGTMHNMVGHAVFPFYLGGAVDMYYFPNAISGTSFATMELIDPDGNGPKANRIGTYELVAFTKLKMPPAADLTENHPFKQMERRICGIFTTIGHYAYQTVINPGETSEIPGDKGEATIYLLFDEYLPKETPFEIKGRRHCLLLCMEIFNSEVEYAQENGSDKLINKLKEAGYYPYSDLDRKPVF